MRLFFLVFFSLYGGMHLYFFVRVRTAFTLHPAAALILAGLLLCMTLAPLLVRALERRGYDEAARLVAWPGYCWLGFLFLFCSLAFPLDLYRLAVRIAALLLKHDLTPFLLAPRPLFVAASFGAFAVSVHGWYAAQDIRAERVTIVSPKIPASVGRIRIAQISDLHLGLMVREARLARVAHVVREAQPDLLVSTGDFVDGHLDGAAGMLALLREMRPRLGKFAVTGNHEYYVGLDQALRFTRDAGFTVLRGEAVALNGLLAIAGVDDPAGNRTGQKQPASEAALLRPLPRNRFVLLLKHQPRIAPESAGLFDLQLSGHVHGGQIFPFIFLSRLVYPIPTGLTRLPGGGSIYVSRGTGTWGPPLRVLAPPEVTIIDLVHG